MEQRIEAILLPVNPSMISLEMPREETDVELHIRLIEQLGAVYWDLKLPRKNLAGPLDGYIYMAKPISAVKYHCIVEQVVNRELLLKSPKEHQYIPSFRKQCLEGFWPGGEKHEPSETWVKISKLEEIPLIEKSRFIKVTDGKPVGSIRSSIVYVAALKD